MNWSSYFAAYANAPGVQGAFWVGGYQSSDTTPDITDDTRTYAKGMIALNTTTQDFVRLDAPFAPVQNGAMVFLPVGPQGVLVYFGGEVPSKDSGTDLETAIVSQEMPVTMQHEADSTTELVGLRMGLRCCQCNLVQSDNERNRAQQN